MQNIKSDFGRKGIRVPDRCPTRAIDHYLGTVHVSTSDHDVEMEIRAEIEQAQMGPQGDEWTPEMVRAAIRYALWQHAENRALFDVVMGASL